MVKRCLVTICFAVIAVIPGLTQGNENAAPGSGPADNGPSLDVTMNFIREKLKAKGIGLGTGPISDVAADPATCQFTAVQNRGRTETTTTTFSFREVEKIQVMTAQDFVRAAGNEDDNYSPDQFVLQILTATNRSVHEERRRFNWKGKPDGRNHEYWAGGWVVMLDEDLANRVAKAMVHTVELCGGGSKAEPF